MFKYLKYLSLNYYFNGYLNKISKSEKEISFSIVYLVISLFFSMTSIVYLSLKGNNYLIISKYIISILLLYRPIELLFFMIGWIINYKEPLHCFEKSIKGFLINSIEIVIYFACLYFLIDAYPSIPESLYSSFRTLVIIGPLESIQYVGYVGDSMFFTFLVMLQIVISFILIGIVISSLVGIIKREELESKKEN
jgi:hypothetical protein